MDSQEAPPISGPSEFDLSIAISMSSDSLPMDGASRSIVTVTARDNKNSRPARDLQLRIFTAVSGTPMDLGSLSARSIATGADGNASFVYTAPLGREPAEDEFIVVDIVVTPQVGDFNNSRSSTAAIRLYPPGVIRPPVDLVPSFTFTPSGPSENQTVLFDASASTGSIVDYQWNFGDGGRASGRIPQHHAEPPDVCHHLTVADAFGVTQSRRRRSTSARASPTAAFVTSPNAPLPNQDVFFNASSSRAAPGRTIVSYQWDFGDGTSGSGQQVAHRYAAAGGYNVTLTVTDDAGRRAVLTQGITIGDDSPSEFDFARQRRPGQAIAFNGGSSTAVAGRTIVSYTWNFGDGTTGGGVAVAKPTRPRARAT